MDKKIAELQEKVTAAKSKVKSMENSKYLWVVTSVLIAQMTTGIMYNTLLHKYDGSVPLLVPLDIV